MTVTQCAEVLVLRAIGARNRLKLDGRFAIDEARIAAFAVHPGGHRQQVAQRDIGLRRIVNGMASGRYFSLNTFVSRPSGIWSRFSFSMMPQAMLVIGLADGGHSGKGFAIASAVVSLVHQPAVTHHQQAAVLAAALSVLERLVELLHIHARSLPDRAESLSVRQPPCVVGRRKVIFTQAGFSWKKKEQAQIAAMYCHPKKLNRRLNCILRGRFDCGLVNRPKFALVTFVVRPPNKCRLATLKAEARNSRFVLSPAKVESLAHRHVFVQLTRLFGAAEYARPRSRRRCSPVERRPPD